MFSQILLWHLSNLKFCGLDGTGIILTISFCQYYLTILFCQYYLTNKNSDTRWLVAQGGF